MAGKVDAKLAQMGVVVPDAPAPAANYVPYVIAGDMVYVSGQISKGDDGLIVGKLGADMDVPAGQAAAQVCALNLIAQVKAACGGDLDRVVRVVKLGGFVNSAPDFGDQPAVINGASGKVMRSGKSPQPQPPPQKATPNTQQPPAHGHLPCQILLQ